MKNWNQKMRKRAMKDMRKRQQMNGLLATVELLRKKERLERRLGL